MKGILIVLCGILCCANSHAQKKYSIVFNSYNSAGFVAGKSPVAYALQTEDGVKIKNWFIGAGFGIDNYYKKTFPLFGAIKKEFPFKKNSLYVYLNAGTNFIIDNKTTTNYFSNTDTKGSFYGDAGIGYKIKIYKTNHLYFTLGNSLKQISETQTSLDTGFPYIYKSQRKFSCIAFKLGFQF